MRRMPKNPNNRNKSGQTGGNTASNRPARKPRQMGGASAPPTGAVGTDNPGGFNEAYWTPGRMAGAQPMGMSVGVGNEDMYNMGPAGPGLSSLPNQIGRWGGVPMGDQLGGMMAPAPGGFGAGSKDMSKPMSIPNTGNMNPMPMLGEAGGFNPGANDTGGGYPWAIGPAMPADGGMSSQPFSGDKSYAANPTSPLPFDQNLMQMFQNPQFMQMIMQLFGGGNGNGPNF